jgi:molybdopterin-guanine dinucleotide biosynthesis protein A
MKLVNAFVLAGGQSTRMGGDKALLEVGGRPLLEHMLELLRGLGLNPRICGSRSDLARFGEVVPDNFPKCGPLAGIEAALALSNSDLNLFVPVDTPGLPREFLRWMLERAESSQSVATIPRFGDRTQPLCAVYSKRLRDGLERSLAAGDCKVMTAVQEAAASLGESVDEFDVESVASTLRLAEWPSNPPIASWFRNLNTPEEYESLCGAGAKGRHPISSREVS